MPREMTAESLLYECVRELQYVQDAAEACGSNLCASALGKELVDDGMKCLGVKWLREDTLADEKIYERRTNASAS